MVDKVNTRMVDKDNIPTIRSLLRKLARISSTQGLQEKLGSDKCTESLDWLSDKTPYKAKKTKRLGESPTDQDMPSPTKMPRTVDK